MKTQAINRLAEDKISKLVLSYTLSTFIALALNSVYTLTDSLFVSWGIGDDAMGGISIVFPFVLIQSAISTALGGGAASIVSRKIGNGKMEEAGEVAFSARIVFYITAVIITLLGFLLTEPMLKAFGATEELYHHAKEYYLIILFGNIFSTGFSSIIRAEGKMLYGLLIWVIPVTVNIILDAVFILVFGWGVKGSAFATVICQFCSFFMSILFFAKFSTLKYKVKKLHMKTVREILFTGLPALVQSLVLSLSLLLINNVLKYSEGTLAINTFAYLNKIIVFAVMPFLALMQAISPIVGYNFGADNQMRVKNTVKFTLLIAFLYSLFALAILESIPKYLIMAFTNNEEIISLGAHALRILALSLPFIPLSMIMGAVYQSEGKKTSAIIMYCISLPFLIVCELLMVKFLGLNGAWWGYVLSNISASLFALIFITLKNKDKNILIKDE